MKITQTPKTLRGVTGVAGAICLALVGSGGCKREVAAPAPASAGSQTMSPTAPDEAIALSLKALIELAQKQGNKLSEQVLTMAGLTEVSGYIIDQRNNDIVLIGRVTTGAPKLCLVDFVAALRAANMQYAVEHDGVLQYTPPGVSIDPDPGTLHQLDIIQRRIFQGADHTAITAGLEEWKTVARGPQQTRILGMPNVRMMSVALQADYNMKAIVDGSVKVPGVTSLSDLHLKARNPGRSSLNRFWFVSSPAATFVQDEGIILLQSIPVGLKTEAEILKNPTSITGTGRADPQALEFCRTFSTHYHDIARKQPIYAELQNSFRWIGLATIMKQQEAFARCGLASDFFLQECVPAICDIPKTLPGIASIREIRSSTKNEANNQWLMTDGGVELDVNPNVVVRQGQFQPIREAALAAPRPQSAALWWRFRSDALARIPQN